MGNNLTKIEEGYKEAVALASGRETDESQQLVAYMDIIQRRYPTILQKILGYLRNDYWLLRRCRLVNKTWNIEACRIIQNDCVYFYQFNHINKYLTAYKHSNEGSLKTKDITFNIHITEDFQDGLEEARKCEILHRLSQRLGNHLSTLSIRLHPSYFIKNNPLPVAQALWKMLHEVSKTLITLQLNFYGIGCGLEFEKIGDKSIHNCLDKLPNLRELQICYKACYKSSWEEELRWLPVAAEMHRALVSAAVNLQVIRLETIENALEEYLRLDTILPKVKTLDIQSDWTKPSFLKEITYERYPSLEEVRLVIPQYYEEACLSDFLRRMSHLKMFDLTLYKKRDELNATDPQEFVPGSVSLHKLEYLSLNRFNGKICLKKLANLKTLKLVATNLRNIWDVSGGTCLHNLTSLTIQAPTTDDQHHYNTLFANLGQLRTLSISDYYINDHTICGISSEMIEKSGLVEKLRRKLSRKQIMEIISLAKAIQPEAPSIRDLTELCALDLFCDNSCSAMTEVSILFGVLHCKKLRRFTFHSGDPRPSMVRSNVEQISKHEMDDAVMDIFIQDEQAYLKEIPPTAPFRGEEETRLSCNVF